MIKANELRIGNWIEGIGMEEPIRKIQDSICYDYKSERYELDCINIKNFKPIPLTEEWLLKFGFIKDGEGSYWIQIGRQEFSVRICQEKDWGVVYSEDVGCDMHWLCFIDHVHQLQNLIFALTGTELTLKDNG